MTFDTNTWREDLESTGVRTDRLIVGEAPTKPAMLAKWLGVNWPESDIVLLENGSIRVRGASLGADRGIWIIFSNADNPVPTTVVANEAGITVEPPWYVTPPDSDTIYISFAPGRTGDTLQFTSPVLISGEAGASTTYLLRLSDTDLTNADLPVDVTYRNGVLVGGDRKGWARTVTHPADLTNKLWITFGSAQNNRLIEWGTPLQFSGIIGPQGAPGKDGRQGPAGAFRVYQYISVPNTQAAVATPTGGSFDPETDSLNPSTGWSADFIAPTSTMNTFQSFFIFDPRVHTEAFTPTWNAPFSVSAAGPPGADGQDGERGRTGPAGTPGAAGAAGTDAYYYFISEQAVSVPADAAGNVTSLTGSTTATTAEIYAYKGSTPLSPIAGGTPLAGQFTVTATLSGTATIVTRGNVSGLSFTVDRTRDGDFFTSGYTGNNFLKRDFTINLEGLSTIQTSQTVSKSRQGAQGAQGIQGIQGPVGPAGTGSGISVNVQELPSDVNNAAAIVRYVPPLGNVVAQRFLVNENFDTATSGALFDQIREDVSRPLSAYYFASNERIYSYEGGWDFSGSPLTITPSSPAPTLKAFNFSGEAETAQNITLTFPSTLNTVDDIDRLLNARYLAIPCVFWAANSFIFAWLGERTETHRDNYNIVFTRYGTDGARMNFSDGTNLRRILVGRSRFADEIYGAPIGADGLDNIYMVGYDYNDIIGSVTGLGRIVDYDITASIPTRQSLGFQSGLPNNVDTPTEARSEKLFPSARSALAREQNQYAYVPDIETFYFSSTEIPANNPAGAVIIKAFQRSTVAGVLVRKPELDIIWPRTLSGVNQLHIVRMFAYDDHLFVVAHSAGRSVRHLYRYDLRISGANEAPQIRKVTLDAHSEYIGTNSLGEVGAHTFPEVGKSILAATSGTMPTGSLLPQYSRLLPNFVSGSTTDRWKFETGLPIAISHVNADGAFEFPKLMPDRFSHLQVEALSGGTVIQRIPIPISDSLTRVGPFTVGTEDNYLMGFGGSDNDYFLFTVEDTGLNIKIQLYVPGAEQYGTNQTVKVYLVFV